MKITRTKLAIAGTSLVAVTAAVGYSEATAASNAGPHYPANSVGQTYGTLPVDVTTLPLDEIPDLVKVVGDQGVEGYAYAGALLGVGDVAPATPQEALRLQNVTFATQIPVFAADGVTIVDTFTVAGHDAGGVETKTAP